MFENDMHSAVARVRDDLLAIAQMFADAEHHKAAFQVQDFARLIVDEAEAVARAAVGKSESKVKIAS